MNASSAAAAYFSTLLHSRLPNFDLSILLIRRLLCYLKTLIDLKVGAANMINGGLKKFYCFFFNVTLEWRESYQRAI